MCRAVTNQTVVQNFAVFSGMGLNSTLPATGFLGFHLLNWLIHDLLRTITGRNYRHTRRLVGCNRRNGLRHVLLHQNIRHLSRRCLGLLRYERRLDRGWLLSKTALRPPFFFFHLFRAALEILHVPVVVDRKSVV